MAPKCPESNFKAKSKASRHDRHASMTGEWERATNRTLLLLGYMTGGMCPKWPNFNFKAKSKATVTPA